MSMKRFAVLIMFITISFACKRNEADKEFAEVLINGLRPALYYDTNHATYTLEDRMKHWNVPAVSFVVIDHMEIVYAGAFGVRKDGDSTNIDKNTLFQAASVSKPVAATGAMTLAYKNQLPLDTDINTLLREWQLPKDTFKQDITIRRILSHTAGLSVGGFTGYPSEDSLPGLTQIIDGLPPANSPAVRVIVEPGSRFMYSGGGYQVMQKVIEELTGKSFPEVMKENVFKPLGMYRSFYAPLDTAQKENAAYGHMPNGFIPNYAPVHVESAAGGLWTTPTDLGILLIELMKAYNNRSEKLFDSSSMSQVLETFFWDFGLGFKVLGEGRDLRFSHGGATRGWHSHFMAFPERGQAVVVMTNGTNGWVLWPEIERSVGHMFNWPNLQPKKVELREMKTNQLEEYTGDFDMMGLRVSIEKDSTLLTFNGAGLQWTLVPVAKDTMEIVEMEGQVFFRRNDQQDINGLHLWFGEPDWSPYREWDFVKVAEDK